jgi:D-3-phosphoglycerate dehydrogenase
VRAGRWSYLTPGTIRRAGDLTVGILGLGRIGKRFAHVSRNCFGRVIACDPYIIDGDFPAYVSRVALAALFEQSDLVSLHVPLTDETRGMINSALLGRMPRGGMLVNTARGAVVDVDAVLARLDDGTLDGAALDVLPVEPLAMDHPLACHPRVLLSPHAAFYSTAAEVELRRKAALNIVQWAKTGRPMYPVVQGTKSPAG